MAKKLVLFDIDHTLLDVGMAHKRVFAKAFLKQLGLAIDFHDWKYHGYTDLQIIYNIMENYGIPKNPESVSNIVKTMIEDFKKEDLSEAVLMKGVPEILHNIKKHDDILIGLVTGNIEEIAYTKLKHFKIMEYFLFGGFGHISPVRSDLIEYALKKSKEMNEEIERRNVFIIGDTIYDINAAKQAKVKCIAVASGTYDLESLNRLSPDYIFKDLSDSKKVIEVIQNG